jgi:hypothetical protein
LHRATRRLSYLNGFTSQMNKGLNQIEPSLRPYTGEWESFPTTVTGFSSIASQRFRYKIVGDVCFWLVFIRGTSNATTFTFTLPFAFADTQRICTAGVNNGTVINAVKIETLASAALAQCYTTMAGSGWATTSTKGISYYGFSRIAR